MGQALMAKLIIEIYSRPNTLTHSRASSAIVICSLSPETLTQYPSNTTRVVCRLPTAVSMNVE